MSKDDFENFGFGDLGPAESGLLGPPGAGAEGLAGAEAVEQEAPAGRKRKKEKRKKAPREERRPREPGEGGGILARLGKASPYGVMLAASLGMILVAILCLLAELARYGFSIRAT